MTWPASRNVKRAGLLVMTAALLLALTGCGGGSKEGGGLLKGNSSAGDDDAPVGATSAPAARTPTVASPPRSNATATPASSPAAAPAKLTTRVLFFNTRPGSSAGTTMLAVEVKNESSRTASGATIKFDLLDEAGKSVGNRTYPLPKIGAGETFVHTSLVSTLPGGIYSFRISAVPAKFVPTIVQPGFLVDLPSDKLDAKIASIVQTRVADDLYAVTGTLTSKTAVNPARLQYVYIVARDTSGAIVSVNVGEVETKGLANPVPAGSSISFVGTVLGPPGATLRGEVYASLMP